MRKLVIATSFATDRLIQKYAGLPFIGVENGIKKVFDSKEDLILAICDFDTLKYSDIKEKISDDKIIALNEKKDYSDTEEAILKAKELGYDEIIILASLQKRYDHSHALLLLLKKYAELRISIEDENNFISYYQKGNYIIQKQDYRYFGLFGFPEAVVSVDNSLYGVKKMKLDFTTTNAISNSLLDRVAIFNVYKGGVLFVQSKDK